MCDLGIWAERIGDYYFIPPRDGVRGADGDMPMLPVLFCPLCGSRLTPEEGSKDDN